MMMYSLENTLPRVPVRHASMLPPGECTARPSKNPNLTVSIPRTSSDLGAHHRGRSSESWHEGMLTGKLYLNMDIIVSLHPVSMYVCCCCGSYVHGYKSPLCHPYVLTLHQASAHGGPIDFSGCTYPWY